MFSPGRGNLLIYITKNQLSQVEYLIDQSIQGNHVLFDLDTVRKVFWNGPTPFSPPLTDEDAYSVEHHLERLISQPSLGEKRAYLEALDSETYEKVVKTYFNIVENNIYENLEVRH